MKPATLIGALSATLASAAPLNNSLYVTEAPQSVRPYVLPKLSGQSVAVGSQIYRFAVTGNSSGGAFTLMNTNAPDSTSLGVLPHLHKAHHENFYSTKGRIQLWAQPANATGDDQQQARELTQGDYGAVPPNTIHTFQITDPDSQLTGVIQPGGFEELFIAIGDNSFSTSTGSEFVPAASNDSAGAGSSAALISELRSYDVYAQLDFVPRRDLVNGSAPAGEVWHTGANALAEDAQTPNFVAKNRGPKYLNTENGYKLVAPLVTGRQSAGNFTMGTVTLSPRLANQTADKVTLPQHVAFQLEEGQLVVEIGQQTATLIQGDVVFVPADTEFSYYASVPFTKFLYVSAGANGFDYLLLQKSAAWNYATYPTYAGFKVQ